MATIAETHTRIAYIIFRRCWTYYNSQLEDWKDKVDDISLSDPWKTLRKLNSRDKPLRFG